MTLGNLTIVRRGELVEFKLNTFHEGQPYALFQRKDIPDVLAFIAAHAEPPTPILLAEDDESWKDLI